MVRSIFCAGEGVLRNGSQRLKGTPHRGPVCLQDVWKSGVWAAQHRWTCQLDLDSVKSLLACWAPVKPKGITKNSNRPSRVTKAVLCLSSGSKTGSAVQEAKFCLEAGPLHKGLLVVLGTAKCCVRLGELAAGICGSL
ncbi:hypothetical protein WJX77_002255 [Trebouxia sp. C0004]